MLISTTVMSERARPTGLAKPERLKRTAEKHPWEIGVRNSVENVEETHGIFHPPVTDLKAGGGHGLLCCSSHLKDQRQEPRFREHINLKDSFRTE